ncbi:MAG: hypothetical protein LBF89_12900 [Bacteroidales bacterium]|nr:hypothetical protein [Bacteroidales bacterium]
MAIIALLTGLLWGIWNLPVIAGSKNNFTDTVLFGGMVLLFCIVCSFYFSEALKQTRTLFVPAAMQGIIASLSLISLSGGNDANYLLAGTQGFLAIISIAVVHIYCVRIKPKAKNDQDGFSEKT